MRILITGAGGNLGTGLVAELRGRHELLLADVVRVATDLPFIELDVRDRGRYVEAAGGVDLLVHTPAWHGIHLRDHPEVDFWDLNVDGTFNAFQAATANSVPRVVWISSQSVFNRDNIYGLSKVVGEELCSYYHRVHGTRCAILRPADFTPYRNNRHYGERLLRGGVDRRDVVALTVAAIEDETVECEAFPAVREDPWSAQDVSDWPNTPSAVVDRHMKGAGELVAQYGLDLPPVLDPPDPGPAKDRLGYQPKHNFLSFLRELAQHDRKGDAESWLESR